MFLQLDNKQKHVHRNKEWISGKEPASPIQTERGCPECQSTWSINTRKISQHKNIEKEIYVSKEDGHVDFKISSHELIPIESSHGRIKRPWPCPSNRWMCIFLLLLLSVRKCSSFTSSSTGSYPGSSSSSDSSDSSISSHPVVPGAVMHLFPRYGYLSLSMRVVPRNDTQNWIFLEPSKDVFLPSTIRLQQQSFEATDNSLPLHNEFHIDLCEDVQQLVQAYFRRFNIEALDKPWHAFAGGWRTPSLAKYFGLDPAFVKGDYRYMLVRVLMVRSAGRADPMPNVTVLPNYADNVHSFRVKDYVSSFNFFNDVGTHYVNSFLTGNSIYQVFVYDTQGFDAVKRRLSETGWVRSSYMAQLPYLLPLWVKHMGKVMVLNANAQTTQNIREALTIRFLFSVYPNIFKMHDNAELVRKIEKYLKHEPDGLLGLELKTLDVIFKDPARRKWFDETLQQTLQLWEDRNGAVPELSSLYAVYHELETIKDIGIRADLI